MTIAGRHPELPQDAVEFLPAAEAQNYVSRLEDELGRLDGSPVLLVHDQESGTSDIIVSDFVNALVTGEGTDNPLHEILKTCFRTGTNFRIWLATNDPMAHKNVVEIHDLSGVQTALREFRGVVWHATR